MRVLILAGTAEAAALAEACAARPNTELICSLAGRTRDPGLLPGELRVGGFGGVEGLVELLKTRAIDRVIDATHPFAAQMSRHAGEACRRADVPRLRLLRPPWRPQAGDRWIEVSRLSEAACRLSGLGRRALLTVGQRDLEAFAGLKDVWLLIRTIEPPARLPTASSVWLGARGPFTLEGELTLMREHAIDVLVTKASGGEATYAKLAAARALGLLVLMVRRPEPPPGPVVASVAEALAWLDEAQPCPAGRST
jgi:precorrin-6A/cobalt-precorrin-6A reductase